MNDPTIIHLRPNRSTVIRPIKAPIGASSIIRDVEIDENDINIVK
jgi:hypothetical protein